MASEEIHSQGTHVAGPSSPACEWEVAGLRRQPLPCTTSSKEAGLVLSESGWLHKEDSKILHSCSLLETILETPTKGGSCERKSSQRSKKKKVGVGEFHFPSRILKRSSRGQIYSLDFLSGEQGIVGNLPEQESRSRPRPHADWRPPRSRAFCWAWPAGSHCFQLLSPTSPMTPRGSRLL